MLSLRRVVTTLLYQAVQAVVSLGVFGSLLSRIALRGHDTVQHGAD